MSFDELFNITFIRRTNAYEITNYFEVEHSNNSLHALNRILINVIIFKFYNDTLKTQIPVQKLYFSEFSNKA